MRSNRVSKTHSSLSKSLTHPFRSLCFPSAAGRHLLQIPCAWLPELLRPPRACPPASCRHGHLNSPPPPARRHSPPAARRHGHLNSPPPAAALRPLALRPRWRSSRAAELLAPGKARVAELLARRGARTRRELARSRRSSRAAELLVPEGARARRICSRPANLA